MLGEFWTPRRLERAIELKAAGYSNAEIGEELGVSRNSVCGKLHREQVKTPPEQYAAWRRKEADRKAAERAAAGRRSVKPLAAIKPQPAAEPRPHIVKPQRICALYLWGRL